MTNNHSDIAEAKAYCDEKRSRRLYEEICATSDGELNLHAQRYLIARFKIKTGELLLVDRCARVWRMIDQMPHTKP